MTAIFAERSDFSDDAGTDAEHDSSATLHGDSYADIVERLLEEYQDALSLHRISEIVAGCRSDLAGTPKGPMAEMIERLARQRIAAELTQSSSES